MEADIGMIGLAVMGQNLVLNMVDNGFTVAVFNRTTSKVDDFMNDAAKGNKGVLPAHDLAGFIKLLKRPRRVMLMIKAGDAIDDFLKELTPLLEKGDIIIDGGNSYFQDSQRRYESLKEQGFLYIGTGVSGGEEGARHGPSIMPGGNPDAWPHVKDILQKIAAKSEDGEPCCDWVGEGGAGHYVKMVHNGIEYGDIQLIGESFDMMHRGLGIDYPKLADTFKKWDEGELNSYLIEITAQIFTKMDKDGKPLLDKILDTAGQKGTGKWTGMSALDMGIPVTLIAEAVFARCLSALKEERVEASKAYPIPFKGFEGDKEAMIPKIANALYAAKLTSYAQGFMLMRKASDEYKWKLNYGAISLMWRGGCIIRSRFLGKIKEAYDKNKDLKNLLLDPYFIKEISRCHQPWREVVSASALLGLPLPSMSSALAFFDGYRTERLPANLLQATRDFFGAHTYERVDQPRGKFFHTNWTGTGGDVSASSYNA